MSQPFYIQSVSDDEPSTVSVVGGDGRPTVLSQLAGGLVTGVQRIPIAGWMFSHALTDSGLVSQEQLNGLAQAAEAGPIGRTAELVGEWAPQLALAAGPVWSLGRKLALGAVAQIGAAQVGGVAGAQAVRSAALAGAAGGEIAGLLTRAMGGPLRKQLADTVLLAAGEALPLAGSPAILRTAEVLAGNALYGALTAGDAILRGEPLLDSVRSGIRNASIGAALEAGVTLATKAAFPGARALDRALPAVREEGNKVLQDFLKAEKVSLRSKAARARTTIAASRSTISTFNQIAQANGANAAKQAMGAQYAAATAALKKATTALGGAKQTLRALDEAMAVPGASLRLLSGTLRGSAPIGSGKLNAIEQVVQKGLLRLAQTPDQMGQKLGVSGQRLMRTIQMAEVDAGTHNGVVLESMMKVGREAHRITGAASRLRSGSQFMLSYASAFQNGGAGQLHNTALAKGLGATQAAEMGQLFGTIEGLKTELHRALAGVGINATLKRNAIPIILRDNISTERLGLKLRDAFMRQGRTFESASALANKLVGMRVRRNAMFTGQDTLNAWLGGMTLEDAVKAGFPVIEDPLIALQTYLSSGWKRVAYAKRLGPNEEIKDILVQAAYREGASAELVNDMANGALLKDYGEQGARAVAAAINNLQTATKMTFAVFPNATQSVLTAGLYGLRQTLKFMAPGGRLRAKLPIGSAWSTYDDAVTAAGLNSSILSGYRETYLDPNWRSPLGWLADSLFSLTQFNRVESWNRKTGAATALYDTVRSMTMLAEGRLKGQALLKVGRRLQRLNLDVNVLGPQLRSAVAATGSPDAAVAQLLNANGGELMKQIAWRGAQITQFLPSPSMKPTYWNTPVGRVMFQFKSFALGQARYMRDAVLGELAHGNPEPLARILAVAPPSGELVRLAQGWFKDKPQKTHGVERLLWDMSALGGFGLVSDTVLAARGSRLLSTIAGPTATDLTRAAEALVSDNRSDRLWKQASQMPAMRALRFIGEPLGGLSAEAVGELRTYAASQSSRYDGETEVDVPTLSDYGRTQ